MPRGAGDQAARATKARRLANANRGRRLPSKYASPPDIVPPHSTGGAIDLTLAANDGEGLDMGTQVNAPLEESQACYTSAQGL
jgi:zinc D-Ala-D-Ala dipeptidase